MLYSLIARVLRPVAWWGRIEVGAQAPARLSGAGQPVGDRAALAKARECPDARVLLCAVAGTTDLVRFPKRPGLRVEVFEPAGGQSRPDEEPAELAERQLEEVRERGPPATAGRVRVSSAGRPDPRSDEDLDIRSRRT